MVIDSSAIIAILLYEPEAEHFTAAIENDPVRLMSAASLLGTASGYVFLRRHLTRPT